MQEWDYRYKNIIVKDVEVKDNMITRMGGVVCKQ